VEIITVRATRIAITMASASLRMGIMRAPQFGHAIALVDTG
jgi:hypothetical protein